MSKIPKLILKIVAGLVLLVLVGLIAIQFVPVNRDNPPVVSEPKWDSPQTKALAERACYDCHSNETKWPWYSNIAPVSWLVARHVHEGRSELNFSELGARSNSGEAEEEGEDGEGRKGGEGMEVDEITEVILKGEMPMPQYVLMHPEAKLTDAETKALIAGLEAIFGAEGAMVK